MIKKYKLKSKVKIGSGKNFGEYIWNWYCNIETILFRS